MPAHTASTDVEAYILDICKLVSSGAYQPGAITFNRRGKKLEALQWEEHFPTLAAAADFVRGQLAGRRLREAAHEGEVRRDRQW